MKRTTIFMAAILAAATVLAAGLAVLPGSVQNAQANPCAVENSGNVAGANTDCVFGTFSGFVEVEQDEEE
jgi:hypothetical protein